jgi:hypothetical protein
MVPAAVIGEPVTVSPVVPPLRDTLVTVPVPPEALSVPAVLRLNPVPMVMAPATPETVPALPINELAATPETPATGSPVAFVRVADAGVPSAGAESVGLFDSTRFPVPVADVTPFHPMRRRAFLQA